MQVRPSRLNGAIAVLFMIGSACFAIGSVPAYLNAVGGPIDGVTYFVGSIFFTTASLFQLVQAQTPGAIGMDAVAVMADQGALVAFGRIEFAARIAVVDEQHRAARRPFVGG